MRVLSSLLVLAGLLLIAACAGTQEQVFESRALPALTQSVAVGESPELGIRLVMEPETVIVSKSGGELRVRMEAINITEGPVSLEFRSGQTFDLAIRSLAGEELFNWSDDRMFTMALRRVELQPGESFVHNLLIEIPRGEDRLEPGTYQMVGELAAAPRMYTRALPFTFNPEMNR